MQVNISVKPTNSFANELGSVSNTGLLPGPVKAAVDAAALVVAKAEGDQRIAVYNQLHGKSYTVDGYTFALSVDMPAGGHAILVVKRSGKGSEQRTSFALKPAA